MAKAGLYNLYSNVVIEDPDSPDGCTALDRENIINDKTLHWSAGGGLQIDSNIFSKNRRRGNVKIDIGIGARTIRSSSIDYIKTKHLTDAQEVPEERAQGFPDQFVGI